MFFCFFYTRFVCRLVSPCVSASQLMLLCAALWSTLPDVTPPSLPSPFSRVSHGNVLGKQSLLALCTLLASHLMLHCVFRPLLQRHLRMQRVLQIHHQRGRMSPLCVVCLLSHTSLSWRGQEGRTLFYLLHCPTSCGKRQWIMPGYLELVLHCLGHLISGVIIRSDVQKNPLHTVNLQASFYQNLLLYVTNIYWSKLVCCVQLYYCRRRHKLFTQVKVKASFWKCFSPIWISWYN